MDAYIKTSWNKKPELVLELYCRKYDQTFREYDQNLLNIGSKKNLETSGHKKDISKLNAHMFKFLFLFFFFFSKLKRMMAFFTGDQIHHGQDVTWWMQHFPFHVVALYVMTVVVFHLGYALWSMWEVSCTISQFVSLYSEFLPDSFMQKKETIFLAETNCILESCCLPLFSEGFLVFHLLSWSCYFCLFCC